jgi:uncharacterized membrane protein
MRHNCRPRALSSDSDETRREPRLGPTPAAAQPKAWPSPPTPVYARKFLLSFILVVSDSSRSRTAARQKAHQAASNLRGPGILLGVGLGGLVDGILLHQILQWHHMLTSQGNHPATTVAGLETNTLWDGFFHAAAWVAVAAGILMLWRRTADQTWGAIRGRAFLGWMLFGWGLFNLIEGIVDHHLLAIHHVREGSNELAWDLAFLMLGALLLILGWALARADEREVTHVPRRLR